MGRRLVAHALIVVGSGLILFWLTADRGGLEGRAQQLTAVATSVAASVSGLDAFYPRDEFEPVPGVVQAFLKETPEASNPKTQRLRLLEDGSSLDVGIHNSYTRISAIQTGEQYTYPWKYVAEPFKATTLTAANGREDASYKWSVDGHTQGYGRSVDVLWTSTGWKRVVLQERVNGTTASTVATKVMVKYVRREIRSLSDRDRETFFQAVMIVQRVPTEVGQRVFGSRYLSKDYFNRVHLYYGGTKDCDHWHQGAGFVTSHVGFTLQFEQALQTIYPDVSMPYWDFTIESTFYDSDSWRGSLVFADDWFGDASPDNDLHTVTEGRWAFVPTMAGAAEFTEVRNSYGLLRSPWNNDPTPFLTRHGSIYGYVNDIKPSGCKEYATAMHKTTWMAMARQLNSAAHGHIHETVGGTWNQRVLAGLTDDVGIAAVLNFAHEIEALSKVLWRAGYITCPDECSMDTNWRECQCECTRASLAGQASNHVLDESGVLDSIHYYDMTGQAIEVWKDANGTVYDELPGYTAQESQLIYDHLLSNLCSPGHIGDMFQATSSNDITFWVLHPTVDRLWHYKRLGDTSNFDDTWDPYHTCYGHNPDDNQPFSNFFDNNNRYYTNAELYDAFSPSSDHMPYMYDNFHWPHCDQSGHSIRNSHTTAST